MISQIIHVVAGPTAAGKTKFALELAQKINGELINADSRQIYKYLDIGTNKGNVTEVGKSKTGLPVFELENSGINIRMLSFVEPDLRYSAFDFRHQACESILEIIELGKVPVLVGGTGLYLNAVLQPEKSFSAVPPNPTLRQALEHLSVAELQTRLGGQLLADLNNSDKNNPVRLIRKIEKQEAGPQPKIDFPFAELQDKFVFKKKLIALPLSELESRINRRVEQMWREGIVDEVQKVMEMGFARDCPALTGSGYPAVVKYLDGDLAKEQCIQLIQQSHRQVAKKQLTWLSKYFINT